MLFKVTYFLKVQVTDYIIYSRKFMGMNNIIELIDRIKLNDIILLISYIKTQQHQLFQSQQYRILMSNTDDYDYLFKCVLIGDSHVGKTQILSKYIDNYFVIDSKPTVGVQFATKTITVDNKSIKNQIWDTAGQERFRALACVYYRGAVGAVVVFDLSKYKSFQSVQKWIRQVKQYSEPGVTILLVGNKNDLQNHEVKQEEIQTFAVRNKLMYISTSAATGQNIDLAFSILSKEIIKKTIEFDNNQQQLVLIDTQSQVDDKQSRINTANKQKYIVKTPNKNEKNQYSQQNTTENTSQKNSSSNRQKPRIQAFEVQDNSKVKLKNQKDKTKENKSKCC